MLAVSGEGAQHSSMLRARARAVPRWLWSAQTPNNDTVPARGFSPSARAYGATCQLQPATSSQRRVSRAAQACCARYLGISEKGAQHSSLLPACAVPRWLLSVQALNKDTAPARSLSLSARAGGETCQLQHPTSSQRRFTLPCAAQARCARYL